MKLKTLLYYLTVVASLPLLNGCTSMMTVGDSEFNCAASEDTTRCGVSTRDLYEVSAKPGDFRENLIKRDMLVTTEESEKQESGVFIHKPSDATAASSGNVKKYDGQRTNNGVDFESDIKSLKSTIRHLKNTPPVSIEATPQFVLKQSEVIRIWIAPWVDENQILHTGGYRFAEISEKKWQIGNEISTAPLTGSKSNSFKLVQQGDNSTVLLGETKKGMNQGTETDQYLKDASTRMSNSLTGSH